MNIVLYTIEGIAIGFLTGTIAALFGVGGGVLAIPMMIFLLNVPPAIAVGTNSVIIIVTTLMSAYFHLKQGTLRKEGIYLGLGGVIGTFIGNELFFLAGSTGIMKKILGILFIVVGIMTLLPRKTGKGRKLSKPALFAIGIFVGTFAALMGMSGGMWLNPTLVLLGMDIKEAIGTSVAALPLITIFSAIPKILAGYVDWILALTFIPGIIFGTKVGAKIMKGSSSKTLKYAFVAFTIGVGIKLLI